MTVDPDTDRYMTVKEIATFFAVKEITVREWLRDGKLTGKKNNDRWRVLKSEVVRYAQELYGES